MVHMLNLNWLDVSLSILSHANTWFKLYYRWAILTCDPSFENSLAWYFKMVLVFQQSHVDVCLKNYTLIWRCDCQLSSKAFHEYWTYSFFDILFYKCLPWLRGSLDKSNLFLITIIYKQHSMSWNWRLFRLLAIGCASRLVGGSYGDDRSHWWSIRWHLL